MRAASASAIARGARRIHRGNSAECVIDNADGNNAVVNEHHNRNAQVLLVWRANAAAATGVRRATTSHRLLSLPIDMLAVIRAIPPAASTTASPTTYVIPGFAGSA